MNKPTILVKKRFGRSDPLFYTNDGDIAEVKINGYRFYAWACGDIRLEDTKTGEEYTNRNIIELYHLKDNDLDKNFEWHNNNWFEISGEKDGKFIDLMIATHSYEDAIAELESIDEDQIKEWNLGEDEE